jgi:hypothetical protein
MFQQLSNHKTKPKIQYSNSYSKLSKETDWTVIRKKIMNKWICRPDWCCLQIRKFLGPINDVNNTKLKLINGYFSLSGFRAGAINYQCIIKLKSEIFLEIKMRKNKGLWC